MNPSSVPQTPEHTFHGLGIAPNLLQVLEALHFKIPTPIQHKAIPPAIEGKDVIGVAQTGTGKTLAFGIPTVQHIVATKGRGLIVLPTRELALQVEETLAKIGRPLGLTTAVLIGGMSMGPQISAIRRDPHIIIATPGRLLDHVGQRTLNLNRISVMVLDEADRMLDMGFWPQVRKIIVAVPKDRQTMLFSATLSKEIMALITGHMKLPVRIEVAPPGTTVERVTQEFFIVRKEEKIRLLEKVLTDHTGSTLVFSRTKHGAKKIMRGVRAMGHSAAEIHGNRSLNQRKEALEGFKTGRYRVLVATDIASRGIDVKGIELVVNYDLPMESSDYVHRIGRTARAGAEGHAISFAEPAQRREMRDIERLIRKAVPVSALPELPPARAIPHASADNRRDDRRGHSFHSSPHKRRPVFGGVRPGSARPFRRSAGRPHHSSHGRHHSQGI
ncbi:DEAD/DEAH box helicase [Candidatus Kaiserbacteria bacterium]|nr:DEAD/DEAH box helicase [Candidatus Kaiserbacteria bacterium]